MAGLKRLQRELRETTKAARELEQAYEDVEVINVIDSDRHLIASISRGNIIADKDYIVEINGKAFAEVITRGMQDQALKDAVKNESNIPDKLRDSILAKFAEDEAIIAELERKLNE